MDASQSVTELLQRAGAGDPAAPELVYPLVYEHLRELAHRQLRREDFGHSLNTTALVHEAYLKLVDQRRSRFNDRAHFFAIAATAMRRILVDHARARGARKRGGGDARVTFDEALVVTAEARENFVALDDALEALAKFDERKSRVVELRFFGGLSVEETAAVLKVSADTVMRDWRLAKAWLQAEMRGEHQDDA